MALPNVPDRREAALAAHGDIGDDYLGGQRLYGRLELLSAADDRNHVEGRLQQFPDLRHDQVIVVREKHASAWHGGSSRKGSSLVEAIQPAYASPRNNYVGCGREKCGVTCGITAPQSRAVWRT